MLLMYISSFPHSARRRSFHLSSSMQLHSSPLCAPPLLSFTSRTPREKPPCIHCSSNGEILATKLMTANKEKIKSPITCCVHTSVVTYCSVTYVTPPFFKKLSPSASFILVECDRSGDPYKTFPIGVHQHPR